MTATELRKRAIALAEKTKIDSVTPEEVGQLSNDIVEYIENVEINGSSLGIRKTYTSVSAMEADSTAPKDDKGVLLRRGMLVNIYNQEDPDSADNGKVFSFQNPGWAFRGTVDAGYATKEELTELEAIKYNNNSINDGSLYDISVYYNAEIDDECCIEFLNYSADKKQMWIRVLITKSDGSKVYREIYFGSYKTNDDAIADINKYKIDFEHSSKDFRLHAIIDMSYYIGSQINYKYSIIPYPLIGANEKIEKINADISIIEENVTKNTDSIDTINLQLIDTKNGITAINGGILSPIQTINSTILSYNSAADEYKGILFTSPAFEGYNISVYRIDTNLVGKKVTAKYTGRSATSVGISVVGDVGDIPTEPDATSGEKWEENAIYYKIQTTDTLQTEEYTITEGCYILLCGSTTNSPELYIEAGDFQTQIDELKLFKSQTEKKLAIDDIDRISATTEEPLSEIKMTPGMTTIFKKWGFISDSLGSGEMQCYEGTTQKFVDMYNYSWGQMLCKLCGSVGFNYSNGGQWTKSWVEGLSGYTHEEDYEFGGAQGGNWNKSTINAKNTPKDAYIITLCTNDRTKITNGEFTLGTIDDIGEYDSVKDTHTNGDSFYGYYAGIIQRILSIQPKAKIFCCTKPPVLEDFTDLNQAIRDIVSKFPGSAYLIDFGKYSVSFNDAEFKKRYIMNGHMNAAGYQYVCYQTMTYIDWIVRNNYEEFAEVALIGTNYTASPTEL